MYTHLASSSKPFYRGGLSRGRGGFQQGPSRPNGPMQISPNHQPGMIQAGSEYSFKWQKVYNIICVKKFQCQLKGDHRWDHPDQKEVINLRSYQQ